jgi:hypothetical protein
MECGTKAKVCRSQSRFENGKEAKQEKSQSPGKEVSQLLGRLGISSKYSNG